MLGSACPDFHISGSMSIAVNGLCSNPVDVFIAKRCCCCLGDVLRLQFVRICFQF